jgi:hypothetical protein
MTTRSCPDPLTACTEKGNALDEIQPEQKDAAFKSNCFPNLMLRKD